MIWLLESFSTVRGFMESGGSVLYFIAAITLLLWILTFDKIYYFVKVYPAEEEKWVSKWNARVDRTSWQAHKIRDYLIADAGVRLHKSIGFIKTLVAVCPLLGLMGTVTGMISVFEVMGYTGTSNARLMASGISMATIPTMAGMVASLSGVYMSSRLDRFAQKAKDRLADKLPYH